MVSAFQPRPLIYIHNHLPLFPPFGFHSARRIASSAISFRLPSASISAAASSDSPLSSAFASDVSGPSSQRLITASLPLSDLRCFSFLSSASVLDSDYSASAFPFLLFPVPPRSCFPGARFHSRFHGFPFLSGLISHAFLPGSCTRLRCSFPFALPCFAPTAVPQVLALRSHFRHFPFPVCFLSSASRPLPATQPSVLPFLLLPVPPHSCFPGARLRSRFLGFPLLSSLISHAFLPGSCTRLPVCFLSPFPDSLPQLFLRCLPHAFAFGLSPSDPLSFVRFSSGSGYSASVSSFPTFPVLLHSSFPGAPSPLSLPWLSPFFLTRFPVFSFPVPVLGSLFVSFHPSRFRSHSRSTGASLMLSLSGFPRAQTFFRPLSLGSDYSAFRSFFSLLPVFPWRRFPRCIFPLPSGLLPCHPSDSGTQLSAIPFSAHCFASQKLPQRPDPCGRFPLAYALGAGYSAFKLSFQGVLFAHPPDASEANLSILPHHFSFVNTFFKVFLKFFNFFIFLF